MVLKENYDDDLKALMKNFGSEKNYIEEVMHGNHDYINMMIYGLEMEAKHETKNVRSEYMSKINAETTWVFDFLTFTAFITIHNNLF